MSKLDEFRELDQRGRASAERELPSLERAWYGVLLRLSREMATRLDRHSHVAAAAWSMPHADELLAYADSLVQAARTADPVHARVLRVTAANTLRELGVRFDVTNPLMVGAAARAGYKITNVVEQTRLDVMGVVQAGYDAGHSIPKVQRAIRDAAPGLSRVRATAIARTELAGLVNGASTAAARITGAADYKQWLAAQDDRVRPDHAEADGQVVAIDQPFDVGGAQLMYPGDQSGPAEEVVNCRCTVIYPDGPEGLTAGGNLRIPAKTKLRTARRPRPAWSTPREAIVAAAQPGTRWQALLVPEGEWTQDTGQVRMIEPGALTWRELPLPLMVQFQTADGHDEARVAGRIDNIYRNDASEVWGEGEFDSGPDGLEASRLVSDRALRGISVDLGAMDVVLELPPLESGDEVPADGEAASDTPDELVMPHDEMKVRATAGVIMGATVTPFAAFERATIELVGEVSPDAPVPTAAVVRHELAMRPITAAAPAPPSGSMVALYPLPDEADALAMPGGLSAEQLHLTLAFIPAEAAPAHDALTEAISGVAAGFGALSGEVSGAGHFAAGDEGTPVVALIDAYGLDRLRTAVLDALDAAGVAYATNHGFTPHVTLSYEDQQSVPYEASQRAGAPVSFFALSAVTANDMRTDLPLESAVSGSGPPSGSGRPDPVPPQPARRTPPGRPPGASTESGVQPIGFSQDDVATLRAAVEAGLLSRNAAAAYLGGEPVPGGDLVVGPGADPALATLAGAIGALAAQGPSQITVDAPPADMSQLAQAVEQLAQFVATSHDQLAQAITAAAAPRTDTPPVLLLHTGAQTRTVSYERDGDGRVTGAKIEESDG